MQRCTLLSIKTGGCPENCNYCSQSSHWSKEVGLKAEKLLELEEVYQAALRAKASGSTRFCMGAAWRGPSQVAPGLHAHNPGLCTNPGSGCSKLSDSVIAVDGLDRELGVQEAFGQIFCYITGVC